MWSPLVDAAEIAAQLSRTRVMLALDIGDVDGLKRRCARRSVTSRSSSSLPTSPQWRLT